jgi:uncharacterized protein
VTTALDAPRAVFRDPLIDALRAWALLGVLIVNAMSYPGFPQGSVLGEPSVGDGAVDWIARGLVACFVQGKAYPVLAFLSGYSLSLSLARSPSAKDGLVSRRQRLFRLLVLGVLHGSLLYAGDILTAYALCGLWVLRYARRPLRFLVHAFRWALSLTLAGLIFLVIVYGASTDTSMPMGYAKLAGWSDFVLLNVATYLGAQAIGGLFLFPQVAMLMLLGMLCARLRYLHHRRWQAQRLQMRRLLLRAGVVLNLIYAAGMVWALSSAPDAEFPWMMLMTPACWLLASAWVMAATLLNERSAWISGVADLGRYTLSVYVGQSLLCALLFSGSGLGLNARPALLCMYAIGLWLVAVALARIARARRWRGPLERWLAGA